MERWYFFLALGPLPAQQAPVTFTSNTTLVIIDVTVKDKTGKVVEDLKKGDFSLQEDGKNQRIEVFDFQKLDLDAPPPPVPAIKADAKPAAAPAPSGSKPASMSGAIVQTAQAAATTSTPTPVAVKPGKTQPVIRYQDRRLVAMLFDFSTMAIPRTDPRAERPRSRFHPQRSQARRSGEHHDGHHGSARNLTGFHRR